MKKVFTFFWLLAIQSISLAQTNQFFVSPTGSDQNSGTNSDAPFATLQRAVSAVKGVDKSASGATVVTLAGGTYSLSSALAIDPTVGGNANHPVTFKAAAGATVLVSGGIAVSGWTPTNGKLYYQKTLTQAEVRDLYVAGERRPRARTNERITGINWVKSGSNRIGILIEQSLLPTIANPAQLELHMQSEWRDAYVPVQSMTLSNGAWDLRSNRLQEVATLTPTAAAPAFTLPFYVENALELLDQPGEWCFDRTTKILYYYPKAGEDINTLEVVVPVLDKLIDINGSSLTSKVSHLTFDGIRFAHTAWNAPSNEGWYGYQAEMLVRPAGFVSSPSVPPGAITINNATNIRLLNCQIRNTGASGVSMPNGVANSLIEGCYLFDNGGSAVQVSNRNLLNADVAGEEAPKNDTIRNNLIVKSGASFFGSPGISSFYTDGLIVDHNTLLQLPYIGISVGFGWSTINSTCKNNQITNNRIDGYMATVNDGGGIYTLGNQPNSLVENNYVKNGIRNYAALYFDEGSAYYTVRNNVIETAPRWLHIWTSSIRDITLLNNWSNVAAFLNKGTNISYEPPILVTDGNWPAGAQTVMANSGFDPSFTALTALLPSTDNTAPTVSIQGGNTRTVGLLDRLTVKAEVSDDGKPFGLLYTRWRKKSGPGTVTLPTAEQTSTLAFFSVPGTYELEFEARDNALLSTKATVQVEVTGATLGTNLALNKAASASSSFDPVTFAPAKGVDGNVNTEWVSGPSDASFSTWTLDFGAITSIQRLELDGRRNFNFENTRQHLLFEIADEPTFAAPRVIAFQGEVPFDYQGTWAFNLPAPVLGRYIRMSHSRSGDNNVTEFRAFGPANVPATGINLSPSSLTFAIGEARQLTGQIIPANATNQAVSWGSSNPAVATVSNAGLVTGVATGNTIITVTTADGNKTAQAVVTIVAENIPVTGVTINPVSATMLVNRTQSLIATVAPADAINKTVSWISSNPAVATVSGSGLVTSVGVGTATITATTQDGDKSASSTITVVAGNAGVTSSPSTWQSFQLSTQTGRFRAEFDVVSSSNSLADALIGFQNGTTPVGGFGFMSGIIRLNGTNPNIAITAHNGSGYTATTPVTYQLNKNYYFRLEFDVPAKRYSIYVTPEGGSEITLGTNFPFRNATVNQLTGWTITSAAGTHTVKNMTFTAYPAALSTTAGASATAVCVNSPVNLSVTATGGTAPYSYTWKAPMGAVLSATGSSAVSATLTSAGTQTFTVTVTDASANPFVSTSVVSVSANALPAASLLPTSATLTCASPSVTLTAEGGGTYAFSGGTAIGSDKIVVSQPGMYSVTVTAANGCTSLATTTVESNTVVPSLSMSPTNATLSCAMPTVSLTATTNATNLLWSTAQTTATISVSLTGSYSVTATGANSCTATASSSVVAELTPPAAPNASSVTATQGNGSVTLTVTNCAGMVSWNGADGETSLAVSTTAVGEFVYAVTCKVGVCTSPVTSVTVTVKTPPASLSVFYRDGDNNQRTNNTIRPYLRLHNEGNSPVSYSAITLRYWLTIEDFAPLTNLSVYWAQLGTDKVKLKYVPLTQPRQGALGYVEYSFDASAGTLSAGGNSGEIQTGIGKQNWTNLNEADDYSFVSSATYTQNSRITVYQNGLLVGGTEPALVTPVTALKVYSENKNSSATTNQISTHLKLANEGNLPVDYNQLALRYWFSAEGDKPLVYTVDYAELGSGKVTGQFVKVNRTGADTYLELRFAPGLGQLQPLSSTGLIQHRINKNDWSTFNEANDHSYKPAGPLAENATITAYLNGSLVYGQEPAPSGGRLGADEVASAMRVTVLGNPVQHDALTVEVSGVDGRPLRLQLLDVLGRSVAEYATKEAGAVEKHSLPVNRKNAGSLLLLVSTDRDQQAIRILNP